MSGAIRTKERCPVCAQPYGEKFECPAHHTFPTRFYIDLPWKGKRLKIYSDLQGDPIDSLRRAVKLHTDIDDEIKAHTFDPAKYQRQDIKNFYAENLLDRFRDARILELAPSYQKDFKRMVAEASGFFGKKDVRDLRKLDLVNYQNHLEAKGIRRKYQKNYLDLVKTFLHWCRTDLEILSAVPPFPKVNLPVQPYRWISREDQIKILDHLPGEDRPIFEFLMLHGCRPAEARALRVKDLDLKAEIVTISSSYSGNVFREQRKGRGSRPVLLPIHSEMVQFFKQRCALSLPGAFVFMNPRVNKPYTANALKRLWQEMRAKAGLSPELRLYDASRHSVATQLRQAGVSLPDIKDQLGHTDIRTTMKYAHGDIEKLRTNLERLSLRKVERLERPQTGPKPAPEEKVEKIL